MEGKTEGMTGFADVPSRYDGVKLEEEVLALWREHDMFNVAQRQHEGRPLYCWNEGPPTANGRPGIHHVLARTFKDIFPASSTCRATTALARPVGHPRPAGRARDREGARDLRQGGDRAPGRGGRVHPPVPRVGDALHRRLGADDRADGLLGEHGRRLLHPRQLVHRVGVVAAAADLGQGTHLPGLQGGAVRPADRRHPLVARGRARVPGGRGPVDLRPLPGGGRGLPPRRRGTHLVLGVDHHALDPALEPCPRRASRGRLRLRAHRFRYWSEFAQRAATRRRLARRRAARRGLPRLSSGGELSRTRSHRHPVLRRDPDPRRGPRRCGAGGRRLHHREAGEGRRPGGDALHAPVRPPPGRRTHLPRVGSRLRDHRGRHRHRALRAGLR